MESRNHVRRTQIALNGLMRDGSAVGVDGNVSHHSHKSPALQKTGPSERRSSAGRTPNLDGNVIRKRKAEFGIGGAPVPPTITADESF